MLNSNRHLHTCISIRNYLKSYQKKVQYIYEMYWEKEYHMFPSIYTVYIFILKIQVYFFPSTDIEHAIISITYVLKFTQ